MKVKLFLKRFFRNFSYYFATFLIILNGGLLLPTPVYAKVDLPNGRDDEFGENNIVFYNPEDKPAEKKCTSTSGKCDIKGDTKDEKLWSGIRGYGFSPEQTAALMGNFAHEGGTPTTQEYAYSTARNKGCKTMEGNPYTIHTTTNEHHSSCMQSVYSHYSAGKPVAGIGLGFVQWTAESRREGYLSKLDELGLKDTYFEGDAYKEYGSLTDDQLKSKIESTTGSDADYWDLWCAAIAYIDEELHSGSYSAFFSMSDVGEMAGYISASYEVCGCQKGASSYNARVSSAIQYYQDYLNGKFDSVETTTSSSESAKADTDGDLATTDAPEGEDNSETGKNVIIIGDSITVRSESEIKALLPDVTINAEVGRNWGTGQSILDSLSNKPGIIVFALGSNNTGGVSKSDIDKVLSSASGSTVIFATNYSLKLHTTAYEKTNTALKSSGAVIADWAAAVSSDPTKYVADESSIDVHPTIPEGTKLFAKTLYEAITKGTLDNNERNHCGGDGETTKTKIGDYDYAFPLQGATQSNYLNPGWPGPAGDSVLSRVPCGSGTCHHDYNAVDLGINVGKVKASDHPGDGLSDMYYYSTGAKVVALVGGTISYYSTYTNKVPSSHHSQCGQLILKGEDGKDYWFGHMNYPGNVSGGDTVTAGQVLGEVGVPQCAQVTQAHLHINVSPQSANDHYIIDVIDKLWDSLPK